MKIKHVLYIFGVFIVVTIWPTRSPKPKIQNVPQIAIQMEEGRRPPAPIPTAKVKTEMPLNSPADQIEQLSRELYGTGLMTQLRAGRLPQEDQKRVAEMIQELTELRARQIEIQLNGLEAKLDGRPL